MDASEKIRTHKGTYHLACIDTQIYTITVEPIENNSN